MTHMVSVLSQKIIAIPLYFYRNLISPRLLSLRHRVVLYRNKSLKNSQRGKRCFILGTGPSINDLDLSLLKDEQVFVVNDFIKHPKFSDLNPSYYVIADTGYFESKNETDFFGRNLKNKSASISLNTKLFLNIVGKKLIEERSLFTSHDIYYLSINGIISDNFNFNINLDQTIPLTKNVILACLFIAVYLGFEEIYLLGCEHSFLANPIRQGGINDINHFYGVNYENDDVTDAQAVEEQGLYRSMVVTYEAEMAHVRQLFKNYRLFFKRVRKGNPNIKIYNATPNSFLDVFPFINFSDIKLKSNEHGKKNN